MIVFFESPLEAAFEKIFSRKIEIERLSWDRNLSFLLVLWCFELWIFYVIGDRRGA
jgi:hypothetical protein